jgi:hypothetical protein
LLTSAQFADVVAQYEQSIAADIIATKQDDRQKREDLYSSLWGTRGLLEFMQLQASASAQIKAPKSPDQEEGVTDYHVEPLYDGEGFEVE